MNTPILYRSSILFENYSLQIYLESGTTNLLTMECLNSPLSSVLDSILCIPARLPVQQVDVYQPTKPAKHIF